MIGIYKTLRKTINQYRRSIIILYLFISSTVLSSCSKARSEILFSFLTNEALLGDYLVLRFSFEVSKSRSALAGQSVSREVPQTFQ